MDSPVGNKKPSGQTYYEHTILKFNPFIRDYQFIGVLPWQRN